MVDLALVDEACIGVVGEDASNLFKEPYSAQMEAADFGRLVVVICWPFWWNHN